MEVDNVSIKSSDSLTTSGEYEIVPEIFDGCCSPVQDLLIGPNGKPPARSPTLNIANNGDFHDMEKNLIEVIHELDIQRGCASDQDMMPPPPVSIAVATTTELNVGQGKS